MREIELIEQKRQKLLDFGQESRSSGLGPSAQSNQESIIDRLPSNSGHERRGLDDSTEFSGRSRASRGTNMHSAYYDADDSSTAFFGASDDLEILGTGPRKGARCPVMGASLIKTGDQVYAPYLKRAFPLTDDIVAQRQDMMRRQTGDNPSATIKRRIEIAQRLQKPKLLSDMQAFKAANPGAIFGDFLAW